VWSILIPASGSNLEALSAELWEMGTAGIVEEPDGLRAFFEDAVKRESIYSKLGSTDAATRNEVPFDPSQLAPLECDAILIGDRFYVAPSWVTEPVPKGRLRLTIDATSAFGSGRHESTQLCMEALEKYITPGMSVADIGCGSGILSVAATALGGRTVVSCDIHQSSITTAQMLLSTPLFVGSADGIVSHSVDLVLANLSLKVLDVVALDLQRIAKPTGLIIIGGFLTGTPPKKFQPWQVTTKGDWECWICRPEDIQGTNDSTEPAEHTQQWWL
jgi:ribosomal protein L11 methyltransferase